MLQRSSLGPWTCGPLLGALVPGRNRIELRNLDREQASCRFWSLELALYREGVPP